MSLLEKFKSCPRCGARTSTKHCKFKSCRWSICTKCVANSSVELVFGEKNFFIRGGM